MTTIRFERDGAIGTIVLANPPFNRLDLRFAEALRIAVHQASESDIRVLVVRSEGRTSTSAAKCANGQARTSTGSERSSRR
jgi:enoyl-CoA hydratase/carnithine racemase